MSNFGETWKVWVRRFWWLRGVAAALTLTAMVPNFVELTRFEFLRAFHAVIIGWNIIAGRIGNLIGEIPFFPNLSGELVNTIIFTTSTILPGIYSATARLFLEEARYCHFNKKNVDEENWALIKKWREQDYSSNVIRTAFLIILSLFVMLAYYKILVTTSVSILTYIMLLSVTFFVIPAILLLPGYGKGLIFIILFIATMEVLYLLNAPWLAALINEFACEALEEPSVNCVSRGSD